MFRGLIMLNFCIFIFTAFFFQKMFRLIFPKETNQKRTVTHSRKRVTAKPKYKNAPHKVPVQCIDFNSVGKKCA